MHKRTTWCFTLNAVHVIVLVLILFGAFIYQCAEHEAPCPLCLLQRLAMIGVCSGALLNLRFGIKPTYYGISLIWALFGAGTSLRQIALHICPQFPKFGHPVCGLNLYAWAFVIFACSILAIAIMLMLYDKEDDTALIPNLNVLKVIAFAGLFLVCLANVITIFIACGWGSC